MPEEMKKEEMKVEDQKEQSLADSKKIDLYINNKKSR